MDYVGFGQTVNPTQQSSGQAMQDNVWHVAVISGSIGLILGIFLTPLIQDFLGIRRTR